MVKLVRIKNKKELLAFGYKQKNDSSPFIYKNDPLIIDEMLIYLGRIFVMIHSGYQDIYHIKGVRDEWNWARSSFEVLDTKLARVLYAD